MRTERSTILVSNKNLNEEFQVVDAITQIYSYLVLADTFVEKYIPANKEIYHLSLILNNIEQIIFKLDKPYGILKDIEIKQ